MRDKLGQLFIVGFEGETPSDQFLEFFAREKLGGIILFEKNCNPHFRAEETIEKVKKLSDNIPFIAVDQEGGRVSRFRGAPAEISSAEEYGRKKDLGLYKEAFSRSAYYLHSLGINLLLGPVGDLDINTQRNSLKGRTFGSSPAQVMKFVDATIKIAHGAGLLTCVKHFPGLGAGSIDPHLAQAIADYDMQSFLNRESLPFMAGIDSGTDMIMTTHLRLPHFDKKAVTESEIIIDLLLRQKLDYDGVVITDDLLMKGSDLLGDYGTRTLKALNAGHDILLFGQNLKATEDAVTKLKEAYDNGLIDEEKLEMSLDRVIGLKSKLMTSAVM